MCFICGQKFGSASLLIHQKSCRVNHAKQQEKIPAEFRKQLPEFPPVPTRINRKSAERFNNEVYELYRNCMMHTCAGCNRAFSDYTKLLAHRSRCDRLQWANNMGSNAANAKGSQQPGGVLSWKARKRNNIAVVKRSNQYHVGSPASHQHDLSSSFDDSHVSGSPTSASVSDQSPRSNDDFDQWAIPAVGSDNHAAVKKNSKMHRQAQASKSSQPKAHVDLSASGNLLFKQAYLGEGDQSLDSDNFSPPALPSPTGSNPSLPEPVLSPEVLESRREYHKRRLREKQAQAASPAAHSSRPSSSPSTSAKQHGTPNLAAAGKASLSEDSPEAKALMARLKKMYAKRRAKH